MNYYSEKKADREDYIISLKLMQGQGTLDLKVKSGTDERLSNIEDLNALLEPSKSTLIILKRWEVVHQIDPDYPYPETEIEQRDWMGINRFLFEDGAKAEMVYDENMNIDDYVYEYIITGISSSHPVVEEAIERIKSDE